LQNLYWGDKQQHQIYPTAFTQETWCYHKHPTIFFISIQAFLPNQFRSVQRTIKYLHRQTVDGHDQSDIPERSGQPVETTAVHRTEIERDEHKGVVVLLFFLKFKWCF
jgi:hypothetical protein